MTSSLPIHEQLNVLADATRTRLLYALEREELTVGELCQVLQAPQSTVSRHLKTLGDQGWVEQRREGSKRFYRARATHLGATERRVWLLVREQVSATATAGQDSARLASVLAERAESSAQFFSATADDWDEVRRDLFGSNFDHVALLGMADPHWTVADLGCGSGALSGLLAPFVENIVAVDASPQMLEGARRRLATCQNVEVRQGDLEALPIEDGSCDLATLFLVLHHVAQPSRVLAEAKRVLRPGGRLLLVDMASHDREGYRQEMGHVWLGFAAEDMERLLAEAGFASARVRALPPQPQAKGPNLFLAAADVSTAARSQTTTAIRGATGVR
ncbi:MAG: metalloregulator ArsR/SmtB family transcription factor [Acidobacteriota bacterium]